MRKAFNIQWNTDGDKQLFESLPQEIEIPDDLEDENEISDYLSDVTGYCHFGFELNFETKEEFYQTIEQMEIEDDFLFSSESSFFKTLLAENISTEE